jgi:UDP-glucuronate 4-epimerase
MILVTGGAGFIGSHVCDKLLELGHKVICLDNFNDYYDPKIKKQNISNNFTNPNFNLEKIDITNFKELEAVFRKYSIKKIIHLAARAGVRPSIKQPMLYFNVNVKGTQNLLELSRINNIKTFIFGSSSSVYGNNKKIPFSEKHKTDNQISPYASSKKCGEILCRSYSELFDMNITCLRFFTVYGPRGRPDMAPFKFTNLISHDKPIEMYGDGTSKRDYTYVADIVNGVIKALEKNYKFEIINLGNSDPIELKKFISVIENTLNKKTKIILRPIPPGDVDITFADISKAKKLLDYDPQTSIEQGIRKFVDWYQRL